jgi:hypothetical protein
MKISSQDDQQNILLLSGDSRGHEPRVLSGIPPLQSVLVHPAMLVLKSLPTDLRDSVPNGAPGEVLITENRRFMCAANDEEHDYDPVLIDIHSGALSGISTTERTAIFRHWRIVVRRGEIEDILLSYPLRRRPPLPDDGSPALTSHRPDAPRLGVDLLRGRGNCFGNSGLNNGDHAQEGCCHAPSDISGRKPLQTLRLDLRRQAPKVY